MKRILFFLALFVGGIFFPSFLIVFLSSVFAFYFFLPFEIIFIGMFLDSLINFSAPSIFTFGFLAIFISAEFMKTLVERESWFGMLVIIFFELFIFSIVCFVY